MVFIFFLECFLPLRTFAAEAKTTLDKEETEEISQEDILLSKIPILMTIVPDEVLTNILNSLVPKDIECVSAKRAEVVALLKKIGMAPGFFSSLIRLQNIFKQKLIDEINFSKDEAQLIAEVMIVPANIHELNDRLRLFIEEGEVKDDFAPNRVIVIKNKVRQVFDFKDFSQENIRKEDVQNILMNTKIPASVIRVEGINAKEMISPIALTDGGKTILLKKGVISSDIKPIMLMRPIKRKAIAHAARREMGFKKGAIEEMTFQGRKIPVFYLVQDSLNEEEIEKALSQKKIPATVNQIEILVARKLGDYGLALTDEGETLLVSEALQQKDIDSNEVQPSRTRTEIAKDVAKKNQLIDLNEDLLTIPAMISGLDLREVYESLLKEFSQDKYDIDINYNADAIAIALIRSTSSPSSFISLKRLQNALIDDGIQSSMANVLAKPETVKMFSKIVNKIRERVLKMSGQKIVIYIDNREIPLLTTGTNANYTPRQISLAQTRLIKERVVLSQVDDIIVVENLDRGIGYTVKSEGKIKAYVSDAFLMNDVIIPPLNWMPTIGDALTVEGLSMPTAVVSTQHPQVKIILVSGKMQKLAQQEMMEKKDFVPYLYKETNGQKGVLVGPNDRIESLEEIIHKAYKEKIAIIIEDSILSSIDIDLIDWMFGKKFTNAVIALEGNGRFRSKVDETLYDFTAIASEFIESIHRPIIEQNLMVIKDELIKEQGLFIDGMRVVPSSDFSIGRMDARLKKIPVNRKQKENQVLERVVLEVGEDLAIALINGDITIVQLRNVLKGGKIKLAPEDKRKWDRQRKMYRSKIKEGSKFDLFGSDTATQDGSKNERMFTAGLNKAFHKSTDWIEDTMEGQEVLGKYIIHESLDETFDELFNLDKNKEDENKVKISTFLKIYYDLQAQNSLLFRNE